MKSTIAFVVILLAAAGYFVATGNVSDIKVFNSELKDAEQQALSFMEDLQFKDFDKAAKYHSVDDQDRVDIPYLIEQKFMVKPEQLDIKRYDILESHMDSTGKRIRIKMKVNMTELMRMNNVDREMMLYFHKKDDGKWYMELESSLYLQRKNAKKPKGETEK